VYLQESLKCCKNGKKFLVIYLCQPFVSKGCHVLVVDAIIDEILLTLSSSLHRPKLIRPPASCKSTLQTRERNSQILHQISEFTIRDLHEHAGLG
jgi:hypothetical protein